MPSSTSQHPVEESGCAEGILIEIEQEKVKPPAASEVCLVDDEGEELDLILWEEMKEGESAWIFNLTTDGELLGRKSRGVQTEPMHDLEDLTGLLKDFPNLQLGGGLLPEPSLSGLKGRELDPLKWTVVIFPRNQRGGGG